MWREGVNESERDEDSAKDKDRLGFSVAQPFDIG